jgi:3-(3-hydroxy-phenyl)propionate hydroxylase
MGLLKEVTAHLLSNLEVYYFSGERLLSKVAPTKWHNGFPLISTFHQPTFEAILHNGLKRFPALTLQSGVSLEAFSQEAEGVLVSVREADGTTRQVQCSYLLACDGARSTVRHALGLPMQGATYAQKWLVIDSEDDPDPSTTVRFFCNPTRPAVTVPSPGQRRRWEFMLLPGEDEKRLAEPATMRALIFQAGGTARPHITRSAIYTFHAAYARTFQVGRVFLLGDAAHLLPPFGGQGMNCGLRDAHNLAWKLRLVHQGLASPALLATYTQERLAHALQLISFSRLLGSIIMPTSRPVARLRDTTFSLLNSLPATRNYLSQAEIKPAPRYRHGFLLRDGHQAHRSLAGRMLPQPSIHSQEDQPHLLDDLLGPGFALLRLNSAEPEPFAEINGHPIWQRMGTRLLATGGEVRAALATHEDLFVLVRPDRYIYGAFRSTEADHFARAWEKSLNNKP